MKSLFSNISFIGGIHGVGKSTICKKICADLNIQYLSASEVLKWKELNTDHKNKKVENISLTQNRLIDNLIKLVDPHKHYLLDGHYCLLDKESNITEIPFETFELINPASLHIITGEVSEIKSRLENRDKRLYDYELLDSMQKQEIKYALELSKKLNINISICKEGDIGEIINLLNKTISVRQ
jgi:adenylate kinase